MGLGLAIAIAGPRFAPWTDGLDGWLGAPASPDAITWQRFVAGPIGGTIAAHFLMLGWAARHASGEAWVRRAVVTSVLAWFAIDTALCLATGATFNVALVNLPCLVLVLAATAAAPPARAPAGLAALAMIAALGCGGGATAPSDAAAVDGASQPDAAPDAAIDASIGAPDAAGADPLGTATATAVPLAMCNGAAGITASRCLRVTVACPGIANMDALVKVIDPVGTATGTILFGTGGGGSGFYELFGAEAVTRILQPLGQQGFRLVERSWLQQPDGWLTGPGGTRALACRYATLLDWVATTLHTGGGLCATGNSGGSSEIAYAMAHYGMGRVLDLGVPTAGPPMGRIDLGCLGTAQAPGWATECAGLRTCGGGGACQYVGQPQRLFDGTYGGGTHCQDRDPTYADVWRHDSVLATDAVLDYPATAMRFVYGDADCSEAVPLGRLYAEAITSDAATVIVPGAPHAVPSVAAGAIAIHDLLAGECVARH